MADSDQASNQSAHWTLSKRLAFDSTRDAVSFLLNRKDLTIEERAAIARARMELFQAYIGQPEHHEELRLVP